MSKHIMETNKLTENAKEVLLNSYDLAKRYGSSEVLLEHVFIALLSLDKGLSSRFLKSIGIDIDKTIESIESRLTRGRNDVTEVEVSNEVKNLIKNAFLLAREFQHVYVGTEHLLLSFLRNKKLEFVKELEQAGLDFDSVKNKLLSYATYVPGIFVKEKKAKKSEGEAVNYFGRNLNELSRKGRLMPIVGRDNEIGRLVRILARHTKNNPILVGEAGVGKTAVVEGFVQRIEKGDVPLSIKGLEVYQIDIASIIAGSKVRGDVEQRLLVLVSEIASSPNKVLFIDEIHMIIGAGATGSDRTMDIANILKPRLTDGSIRVIGATTIDEYRQYFEEDSALSRRFQPIMVDEISVNDSIKILKGIRHRLEEFHGVKITNDAVEASALLSNRYITDRFLPDKAIDVLDEAAAYKKLKKEDEQKVVTKEKSKLMALIQKKNDAINANKLDEALSYKKMENEFKDNLQKNSRGLNRKSVDRKYEVKDEDIKTVISEWTSIPVNTLSDGEIKALKTLSNKVSRRIAGQKDAVNKITSTLKRARMGISDERRPLASFLFLGPTGVGKTETAKVIAEEFFGSEKALIQVDMSEFMEQHSIAKILGSPPGYVGYQEGGHLTEKVRKRPYSVVLFDEIEKAHPELLNALLQILEEGSITDGKGRKINFKNTVIIMTSNIGAQDISKDKVLGFRTEKEGKRVDNAYARMRDKLTEDLKKSLRPEFINRIDEIVIFRGLDEKDAEKITKILISDLKKRLKKKKIVVELTDSAIKYIARKGFSDEYGARNIRRKIQELVENPLSDLLVESGMKKVTNVRVVKRGNNIELKTS